MRVSRREYSDDTFFVSYGSYSMLSILGRIICGTPHREFVIVEYGGK